MEALYRWSYMGASRAGDMVVGLGRALLARAGKPTVRVERTASPLRGARSDLLSYVGELVGYTAPTAHWPSNQDSTG